MRPTLLPPPGCIPGDTRDNTIPSGSATIYDVNGEKGLDFNLSVADIDVQFGDDNLTAATFDATLAMRYKVTNAFGVEGIGPPLGATKVAVKPVIPDSILSRQEAPLPSYGGAKQMITWADASANRTRFAKLSTPIGTSDDVSIVIMCKSTNAATMTICGLYPAADTDVTPVLRLNIISNSGNVTPQVNISNNIGQTATAASGSIPMSGGEWNVLCASYNRTTHIGTLFQFNDIGGVTALTTGTARDLDQALSHLIIGGNASGAQFFQGSIAWIYVTRQQLTGPEVARMYGPNALPAPMCPNDKTKTVLWLPIQAGDPKLELCANRQLQNTASSSIDDANITYVTSTAPAQLPPNRLQLMSSATVKQHAFTGADSTPAAGSTTGALGAHRGYSGGILLDADVGAATPDPDNADHSAVAVTRAPIVGIGENEKISVQSNNGVATGTLNLVGLTYGQAAGTVEWEPMSLTNSTSTGPSGQQIDFELGWNGGPEGDYRSWRDPNNATSRKICFLGLSGATPTGYVGELNPITGGWLNPSTYGMDYSLGTWDGISTAIKSPHFCLVADAPYKIAGIITSNAGGGSGTQAVVRTLTFDSAGGITGGSNDVLADAMVAFAASTLGVKNALGSQCLTDTQVFMCGALPTAPTARNLGYIGEDTETWKAITNSESADPNVGFRFTRRLPYIITTDTTGAHEGAMRWTKYTDDTTGVIVTDSNYVGAGGSDFDFDAEGWLAPEGDGDTLWFLGQTSSRTTLRFYAPSGTGSPISSAYAKYRDCPVPAGAGAAVGTFGWAWQSPEPVIFNSKSYMLCTLKDCDAVTDSVVNAHKTQIWLMGADGSTLRLDRGASDGVARINHEAEYSIAEPDSAGRIQLLVYVNECTLAEGAANQATKRIVCVRTGMFETPTTFPDQIPFVRDVPQLRLYGALDWTSSTFLPVLSDREFSSAEEEILANRLIGWYNSNEGETALRPDSAGLDRLRAYNPDMFFLAYNNSAYSLGHILKGGLNDVVITEADPLHVIAVYKEGTLGGIGITGTGAATIHITPDVANALVASGPTATTTSLSLTDCVTFIRIDNEFIRIPHLGLDTSNASDIIVSVAAGDRGFGGTVAVPHLAGVNVYAPIYIRLAYPNSISITPEGPRYACNITATEFNEIAYQRPKMAGFMNNAGRDGIHLDVFTPSFNGMHNALGANVTNWNFGASHAYTEAERELERETEGATIRADLLADTGVDPILQANNLNDDYKTTDGEGRRFFSTGTIDYGMWEGFACKPSGGYLPLATWLENLGDLCDAVQAGYGSVAFSKPQTDFSPITLTDDYIARQFYDYCSYLLVHEPTNTKAAVGTLFLVASTIGAGNWTFHFPDHWYYDIGTPVTGDKGGSNSDLSTILDPLKVSGWNGTTKHSYDREYTRCYVIINPDVTDDSAATTLPVANHAHWRHPTTLVDTTTVTLAANTCQVYMAWDFEADTDSAIGTVIATMTPGTNCTAFGTGPYTWVMTSANNPFKIATNGDVSITGYFIHNPTARYVLTATATDSLAATHDYEVLIVTKE